MSYPTAQRYWLSDQAAEVLAHEFGEIHDIGEDFGIRSFAAVSDPEFDDAGDLFDVDHDQRARIEGKMVVLAETRGEAMDHLLDDVIAGAANDEGEGLLILGDEDE